MQAPRATAIPLSCTASAKPLALHDIVKELGRNMQIITGGISREDCALIEMYPRGRRTSRAPLSERPRIMAFAGTNADRFKAHDGESHTAGHAAAKSARAKASEPTDTGGTA